MSKLIEFLEQIKTDKRKLAYALTDGYEVVIFDPKFVNENSTEDYKSIFTTDIHDVLHDLMKHYRLENQSP